MSWIISVILLRSYMLLYLHLKLVLHDIKMNNKIQANNFYFCLLKMTLNNRFKKPNTC